MENQVELKTETLGVLLGLLPESNSIPELQISYKLSIPSYQRIYCWEEKNVMSLLDDIQTHGNKTYHMGSIILHKTGLNTYDIVDGQQRLVTLSLLLLKLGANDFGLLNETFESSLAQNYIAYNKWIIDNYLSRAKFNKDNILKYLTFSVLVLDSCSLDLAYTFFTAENGRGKSLTDFDLLKSHHLRFIHIPEQAQHLAERWDNMVIDSNNDDNSKKLGRTFDICLFRLRKWMRKQTWDNDGKRKVKTQFEAAPIISDIPPFGEQFRFYESIQGGAHFFAYAEHFVHRYVDFSAQTPCVQLHKHLNWEKHWWYRDVIESLLFAYYLKFGNLYLTEAFKVIAKVISQHRYESSRAYLNTIFQYVNNVEVVMMIDQATSPTFFLAEMELYIKKLPEIPVQTGTRKRYQDAMERIIENLPQTNSKFNY